MRTRWSASWTPTRAWPRASPRPWSSRTTTATNWPASSSGARSYEYDLPEETRDALRGYFAGLVRDDRFGNGRTARQTFQRMTERHAQRVVDLIGPTKDDLGRLLPEDLPPSSPSSSS
ncbi:hypothetical protein ACFO3J_21025 [Streptomyces polygonati]|uniref:CbbX AAA lid domain-containing protein n=1 Tax=Streptomyces polygonati TaxID=1617087 RepID=A0ABV8HPL3_9ACTN